MDSEEVAKISREHELTLGRVLVVDDETELMKVVCRMLAVNGYETRGCSTGEEALDALEQRDFDVLLTDLMMPTMDGISLLRAGLEIDPNLVSIIMTGQGTVETAAEAMEVGAFDYVTKPFRTTALLPVLSRAMKMRRLRQEGVKLRETIAIYQLTGVAVPLDLDFILKKAGDVALQKSGADEVSIMLPTRDNGEELYVAAAKGNHPERFIGERVSVEHGIAGWVARNREPLLLCGPVDDTRFKPVNPRSEIRSAFSVPMMASGKLVGVVNLNVTNSVRPFTLGQAKGFNIFLSIVAPTLEHFLSYSRVQQAEEKYRCMFENAPQGIFQTAPDGHYIDINPAFARIFGYESPAEMMQSINDIGTQLYVDPGEREKFKRRLEGAEKVERYESTCYHRDGRVICVSINAQAVRNEAGAVSFYQGSLVDITKERQAREDILRLASFPMLNPGPIIEVDSTGAIIYSNPACLKVLPDLPGRSHHPFLDGLDALTAELRQGLKDFLVREIAVDGRWYLQTVHYLAVSQHTRIYAIDTTSFKEIRMALVESEEQYRMVVENSSDGITIKQGNSFVYANKRMAEILGWDGPAEIVGQPLSTFFTDEGLEQVTKHDAALQNGESAAERYEVKAIRKNGTEIYLEISATRSNFHGSHVSLVVLRDIAERKDAEQLQREGKEKLAKANRALRALSAGNELLVKARDEMQLIQAVCTMIVETGGYAVAWVGYVQDDAEQTIVLKAYAGVGKDHVNELTLRLLGAIEKGSPVLEAIRLRSYQLVTDTARRPDLEFSAKHGVRSILCMPLLTSDGRVLGVLNIDATEPHAFDLDEIGLLQELANGQSFGIETLRMRTERDRIAEMQLHHNEELRQSFEATVQAISATVEMRDAGTAGHQQRVADLAAEIAREMGLQEAAIQCLHLAGILHDVGKIHVPADILNRAGRLSEAEYMLVKTHSEAGYDILKGVKFPWPVADIVVQHHERLDGSGYPRALNGESILLESRILGVADVVEAMTSDRPYRPAFAVDAALDEISRMKGVLYDPEVVEACLRLFRKKGFKF